MIKLLAKMNAKNLLQALHPSFLSVKYLLCSFTTFFSEEFSKLLILFSAVFVLHKVFLFSKLKLWLYWAYVLVFRKFMAGAFCSNDSRLNGSTIIITGATSGVGKEVARQLALRGAHLVLACKDVKRGEETKKELQDVKGSCEVRHCDLASLQSVRDFAEGLIKHKYHLHMLINIAGEMMVPEGLSEDELEHQMAVNHLGHFLLTNMLLPWLTHNKTAKIVNVASLAHLEGDLSYGMVGPKDPGFTKWKAYCNSQLATALFSRELRNRTKGTNVQVFCANHGIAHAPYYRHVVPSFLMNSLTKFLLPSAGEAAQTITFCATDASPKVLFYSECSAGWPSDSALDDELARKWWKESEKLVGLEK